MPESLLIKLQAACNFNKKETLAQVFSSEFCEISKNIFFTEHLWTTASETIILIVTMDHFVSSLISHVGQSIQE